MSKTATIKSDAFYSIDANQLFFESFGDNGGSRMKLINSCKLISLIIWLTVLLTDIKWYLLSNNSLKEAKNRNIITLTYINISDRK